jgi:predicted flap endonuclease-1-like 5' DNA nuclease
MMEFNMFAKLCDAPGMIGVLALGILLGWLLEWIFVRLFVPNPGKKLKASLDASQKQVTALQQQIKSLQSELAASKATLAKQPESQQPILQPQPVAEAASAESAPVVATVAESVGAGNDDLTRLSGIGPKLAEAMTAAGINSYTQLTTMTTDELNERLASSGIRYAKVVAESWAGQAKLAAAGDWDGLKDYQASLKA